MTARAQRPRDPDGGPGAIVNAAARLEIKEFDLFARAHNWWFGRRADPAALERTFAAYMFGGAAPPWVRQYVREIQRELGSDTPSLARLGLDQLRRDTVPPRAGLILTATCALFAVLYVMILDTAADPQYWATTPGSETTALSCSGGGPGLKFFEGLAYALSGRDVPACD